MRFWKVVSVLVLGEVIKLFRREKIKEIFKVKVLIINNVFWKEFVYVKEVLILLIFCLNILE